MQRQSGYCMSMLFSSLRISLVAVFALALNACGGGGGGTPTNTNSSTGTGIGGGTSGGGTGGGDSGSSASAAVILYGQQLWKTDGTSNGTLPVYAGGTAPFTFAYGLTEFNGEYYFQANSSNGFELWKTDGSAAGTVLVLDINPGTGSAFHYRFAAFTAFNGALYFQANDGVNGYELWRTDGTAAGTVLLKDINPTPGAGSTPSDFTVFNGALYFSAGDSATGMKLWKTDGTTVGTTPVTELSIATGTSFLPDDFSRGFPVFNGALYFRGAGGLWRTDGSAAGAVLNEDISTAGGWFNEYLYHGFTVFNNVLYVPAEEMAHGREIWRTNGTAAGTALLKDINTENGGRRSDYVFNEFIVFNGALYFQARDNVNGYRIWKTDGTADGTVLVKSFGSWPPASGFRVLNGALYFLANGLWKTDGTTAGTVLVKDFSP